MASGIHRVSRSELGYYAGTRDPNGLVEPTGVWSGRLAHDLELADRPVDLSTFSEVLAGRDPGSGEQLNPHHARVGNAAYDIVLTAPKSVSVLFALGDRAQSEMVAAAHQTAVAAVVGFLERNAAVVRRTDRGVVRVVDTGALLAAGFQHWTSRAGDPHLHTHLLVTNLARDPDGRWSALDGRELYARVGVARSLYTAHLRHELALAGDLHFTERRPRAIDLAGARERMIRLFSRRSLEIAVAADAAGIDSASGRRVVGDATRPEKEIGTPWPELVEQWSERAERAGISRSGVSGLGERSWSTPPRSPPSARDVIATFDRPFSRSDLLARIADRSIDGAAVETVERIGDDAVGGGAVRTRPPLRFAVDGGREWRIPRAVPEQRWASAAVAGAIDQVAAAIERATWWTAEAVRAANGIARTSAGTGGLALVHAFADATVAAGGRVRAIAPTDALAGHFAAVTGIEVGRSIDDDHLGARDAVIVFGAPMIAPTTLAKTLEACRQREIAVVVVDRYDSDRHQPLRTATLPVPERVVAAAASTPSVRASVDPRQLLSVVEQEIVALRRAGREPVVVAVEPFDGATQLDAPVMGARQASGCARVDPLVSAVVIGDGRVLSASGYRSFGGRRVHVVVEPLDPTARKSLDRSVAALARERPGRGRDRLAMTLDR